MNKKIWREDVIQFGEYFERWFAGTEIATRADEFANDFPELVEWAAGISQRELKVWICASMALNVASGSQNVVGMPAATKRKVDAAMVSGDREGAAKAIVSKLCDLSVVDGRDQRLIVGRHGAALRYAALMRGKALGLNQKLFRGGNA